MLYIHLLTIYQHYVSTGWKRAGLHNSSYRTQKSVYQHLLTTYQQLTQRVITSLSTVYQLLIGVEFLLVNYQQSIIKAHVKRGMLKIPSRRHTRV
jgi:hypothetical protein